MSYNGASTTKNPQKSGLSEAVNRGKIPLIFFSEKLFMLKGMVCF